MKTTVTCCYPGTWQFPRPYWLNIIGCVVLFYPLWTVDWFIDDIIQHLFLIERVLFIVIVIDSDSSLVVDCYWDHPIQLLVDGRWQDIWDWLVRGLHCWLDYWHCEHYSCSLTLLPYYCYWRPGWWQLPQLSSFLVAQFWPSSFFPFQTCPNPNPNPTLISMT